MAQPINVLATEIVKLFQPKSVLHYGCSDARLIEALYDLGVSSFGIATGEIDLSDTNEIVADQIFVMESPLPQPPERAVWFPVYDLIVTTDYLNRLDESQIDSVREFLHQHSKQVYSQVLTSKQGGRHRLEWWQNLLPEVFFEEMVYD